MVSATSLPTIQEHGEAGRLRCHQGVGVWVKWSFLGIGGALVR